MNQKWFVPFSTFPILHPRTNVQTLQRLYNASDSNIKWAKHCLERMQERDISINDVESCLQAGEIIGDYPDDFPHPSCLIFEYTEENKVLHIVVGSKVRSLSRLENTSPGKAAKNASKK
ncbi:DUF4258 domain-containing protein [bacterium D16-51]|nr:DUF4258 domain-containing protein [bacterium D16-59]RKI60300.1 DUF4258 domain-containing protein [bacterium D16-51]